MRIPFLHRTIIGLHVTRDCLFWVEMQRFGRRTSLVRFGSEAFSGGDPGPVLDRLKETHFRGRVAAVTSLNAADVERIVFDVPEVEDDDMLQDWIENQQAHLTAGPAADTVSRILLADGGEQHLKCVSAAASREAFEERVRMVESAGLAPAAAGDALLEAGYAYMADPDNRSGTVWIVFVTRTHAHLLAYRNGTPAAVSVLHDAADGQPFDLDKLGSRLEAMLDPSADDIRIILTGDVEEFTEPAGEHLPDRVRDRLADSMLDFGNGDTHQPLPAACAPAAGAALRYLTDDPAGFNFLSSDVIDASRTLVERRDATRLMLALGLGLLLLLAGGQLANGYLTAGIAEADASIAAMSGRIAAIDLEEAAVKRLRYEVNEGRQLVSERTFAAGLIEKIGTSLPDGVWLTRLETEFESDRAGVRVSGLSGDEAGLTRLMRNLEMDGLFRNVRLVQSEVLPAKGRHPESVDDRDTVLRFDLTAFVPLIPGDEP